MRALAGLALAAVLALAVSLPAGAQQEPTVELRLDGIELSTFLRWLSQQTGRRIAFAKGRDGTPAVTLHLYLQEAVKRSELLPVAQAILEMNGYTLVDVEAGEGSILKLVKLSEAPGAPVPFATAQEIAGRAQDKVVSHVVQLRHVKAGSIVQTIRQSRGVAGSESAVVEVPGTNAILVTTVLTKLRHIQDLAEKLDKLGPGTRTHFVRLEHARAEEVKAKLAELYAQREKALKDAYPPEQLGVTANPATNTLILEATEGATLWAKPILAELDSVHADHVPVVRVYRAQHAKAKDLIPPLQGALGARKEDKAPEVGGLGLQQGQDERMLVITATPPKMARILELLRELDVRKRQILVEAIVFEATPGEDLSLGIELSSLEDLTGRTNAFSVFGLSSLVDRPGTPVGPAGRLPIPGQGANLFYSRSDRATSVPVLLRALQTLRRTRILSTPRVLAVSGEKAEIRLEDEEPVVSTTALTPNSASTSFSRFVSAGTTLTLTPTAALDSRYVRLELELKLEAFKGGGAAGVPPPKTSRTIKTTADIRDGQSIFIGGLAGWRDTETEDRVPVLADIPAVGALFRSTVRQRSAVYLYVFVSPRILDDEHFRDLEQMSRDAHGQAREALRGR